MGYINQNASRKNRRKHNNPTWMKHFQLECGTKKCCWDKLKMFFLSIWGQSLGSYFSKKIDVIYISTLESSQPQKQTLSRNGSGKNQHASKKRIWLIFHQPRFPWNSRGFPSLATFWGPRSCEVTIIWPERIFLPFPKLWKMLIALLTWKIETNSDLLRCSFC